MIFVEVLFVVAMFLWFLSLLPWPPMEPWRPAGAFLAFVAVLLLGFAVFLPLAHFR